MTIQPLPNRHSAPKPLSHGLDRVVRSLGLPSADSLGMVFSRWSEIVGDELSGQCQPVSLNKGRLVVQAADQAWATELRWLTNVLIDRCAATLGSNVVTSVHIRL